MEIKIADSFWKSLKTLRRHQTWWYKTYEVFRYKIPMFLENLWFFRKELWKFRSWDYTFNLQMLKRTLEKTCDTIEHYGHEVDISRLKKVSKMKRAISLIDSIVSDDYISRVEAQIGPLQNTFDFFDGREDTPEETEHNRKVFKMAQEFEDFEWKELFIILKGQDLNEYKSLVEKMTHEEMVEKDVWNEWFDGSGMKTWWD